MLSHVLRTIRGHDLLGGTNGRRLLCAVSGGPDSMALLACLWELAPRLELYLEVATVDHGLRPQAAVELELVRNRAADIGVKWHPLRVDVPAARRGGPGLTEPRGGIQEVARRLRLAALADLAAQRDLDRVALGHTADDQTETILFRVLRGTGLRGLAGIPYQRPPFVRPLLDVTRAQVLVYLGRRSLPFVTDPSNADPRFTRARLRHQILPLLRAENPRVDQALRRLGAAAAGGFQMSDAIAEVSRDGVHVPSRLANQIADAARDGRGSRSFDLPGHRRISVSYGHIRVDGRPPDVAPASERPVARGCGPQVGGVGGTSPPVTDVVLPGPGTFRFGPHAEISLRLDAGPVEGGGAPVEKASFSWCWFDADQLVWPLRARPRHPGDRMSPRGGAGSRKLSDLMIDAKVPRALRGALPVVTDAAGVVLFVPGLRPARAAGPSGATVRRIGLAVVTKADHDGLVDHPIIKGNTQQRLSQNPLPADPDDGRGETRKSRPIGYLGGTSGSDGRVR